MPIVHRVTKNPDLPRHLTERSRSEILQSIATIFIGAERRLTNLVRSQRFEFNGEEMEFFGELIRTLEEARKAFRPGSAREATNMKSDLATIVHKVGPDGKNCICLSTPALTLALEDRVRFAGTIDWDKGPDLEKLSKGKIHFEALPNPDTDSSKLADLYGRPVPRKKRT